MTTGLSSYVRVLIWDALMIHAGIKVLVAQTKSWKEEIPLFASGQKTSIAVFVPCGFDLKLLNVC